MSLVTKILVPTDFSEGAGRAIEYAIEIGRAFSASVLIVHVYAVPVVALPEGYIAPTFDEPAVIADLGAGLARLAGRVRDRGISVVDHVVASGVAWREILRVAHEQHCDLIVMGTHGRGAVAHLLLGSVAEKVVRKAECPVLTVGPRTSPRAT